MGRIALLGVVVVVGTEPVLRPLAFVVYFVFDDDADPGRGGGPLGFTDADDAEIP